MPLLRERNLLRSLVDSLPEQVSFKDAAGRKLLANAADAHWRDQFGAGEIWPDKTDADIFPPEIAARCAGHDRAVLEEGRAVLDKEERVVDAPPGRAAWLPTSRIPIRDDSGMVVGLAGIGRGGTESTLAELAGDLAFGINSLRGRGERTLIDAGQVEQAIIYLAMNARDVMPEGGGSSSRRAKPPSMTSPALRLPDARPGLRIPVPSGYLEVRAAGGGPLYPESTFLRKPVTPSALLRAVPTVLDHPSPDSGR